MTHRVGQASEVAEAASVHFISCSTKKLIATRLQLSHRYSPACSWQLKSENGRDYVLTLADRHPRARRGVKWLAPAVHRRPRARLHSEHVLHERGPYEVEPV